MQKAPLPVQLTITSPAFSRGDILFICTSLDVATDTAAIITNGRTRLPAGAILTYDDDPLFQVLGSVWLPSSGYEKKTVHATYGCWVEALAESADDLLEEQDISLTVKKTGLSLAWVTISDKGSRGEREDKSGPAMDLKAREALHISFSRGFVIPDEEKEIHALLVDLTLMQQYDLVLTSGGTGLSPRDVTPEATLTAIEKRLPGFERAMTSASLQKTHHAMISRAVAGTLGQSVIVNLPGSIKGVIENLEAILPALPHAIEKLQGSTKDCGT